MKFKKYKKSADYSYTLGVFPTLELVKNRREKILKVYLASNSSQNKGAQEIVEICKNSKVPFEVSDKAMNRLSTKGNIYAIGIFEKFESNLVKENDKVVLVNPSNSGNLGTIIRTMLGFGVKDLGLIKPAVDIFHPEVVRSSMGSLFKINFEYFENFKEYQQKFGGNIYPFLTNGKNLLTDVNFKKPFTLVFGNEGQGLPPEFDSIGETVKIPQSEEIDSFNLAISVGVGLYAAKGKL